MDQQAKRARRVSHHLSLLVSASASTWASGASAGCELEGIQSSLTSSKVGEGKSSSGKLSSGGLKGKSSKDSRVNVGSTTTTGGSEGAAGVKEEISSLSLLNPFHLAIPVHDIDKAREFYGNILGLQEGRSAIGCWTDYSLFGHQLVVHKVDNAYRAPDLYNPVDKDYVPVPHFGCALTVPGFHELVQRLREKNIQFIVEPHIRFPGQPGEQWTCFFKDPSNNSLEFKAMSHPANLFARYVVVPEQHEEQQKKKN
jgi:extradiol dioxygenase family protein